MPTARSEWGTIKAYLGAERADGQAEEKGPRR